MYYIEEYTWTERNSSVDYVEHLEFTGYKIVDRDGLMVDGPFNYRHEAEKSIGRFT